MPKFNNYANYFQRATNLMQANKNIMVAIYSKFPFIGKPYRFWDDPTHLRPYTRPSLTKLAQMAEFSEIIDCFFVHRWAHLLALPLALVTRNNEYKTAVFHSLGLFCGIIVRK